MNLRWRLVFAAVTLGLAAPAMAARDVLLVLDNSGSMKRNDPQRLAPPAVTDFVKSQPPDTRIGIILFDAVPELVLPLMPAEVAADGEAERVLKDRFRYNGRQTQTAGAIERALYELRSEGRRSASRAIVLMTDGLIDTGDPQKDRELDRWLRQDLAAQARRDNVRIFGIAFTEKADYELLQSLATATNAEYFRALNPAGIAKALARIESLSAAEAANAAPSASPAPAVPAAPPVSAPEESSTASWPVLYGGAATAGLLAILAALFWWWRSRDAAALDEIKVVRGDQGPIGVLFDSLERHELGARPVVIGRASGNDPSRYYIVVPEKTVGRWHATIERRGQTFWLRDEGSVNGTFLNGERVVGERPLKHRDSLRVHTHVFEFEIPELADADRTVMQPASRVA